MADQTTQDQNLHQRLLEQGLIDPERLARCDSERDGPLAQALLRERLIDAGQLALLLRDDSETAPGWRSAPGEEGPSRLERYELVREIGRGGMGLVYQAIDPDLRRMVALKVLRFPDSEETVQRLLREARLAAQLSHPHIVRVHEVGQTSDNRGQPVHFIAMDYIEGRTLSEALPELSLDQRIEIMTQITDAMGHAHAQGVVHRDLKPANVMLTPDQRAIVTDFGLARGEADSIQLTRSDQVMGTVAYMSPEQVQGQQDCIDARADVWALGVMLYEILSDAKPFEGVTTAETYQRIIHTEPLSPGPGAAGSAGRELETICLKALEKLPGRRYPTAAEMSADLRRWKRGEPIHALPPTWSYLAWKWTLRHKPLVGAIVVLALLGGAMLGYSRWWRGQMASQQARTLSQKLAAGREDQAKTEAALRRIEAQRVLTKARQVLERARGKKRQPEWFDYSLHQLIQLRSPALVRMLLGPDCLDTPHEGERQLVIAALGRLGDTRTLGAGGLDAVETLLARLAQVDLERNLEEAVMLVTALGYLKDPRAFEPLERLRGKSGRTSLFWSRTRTAMARIPLPSKGLTMTAEAHLARGLVLRDRGDNVGAMRCYDRAIQLDPKLASAYQNRAITYVDRGQLDAALTDLDSAIRCDPRNADLFSTRGLIKAKLRRYVVALADLKRAIELDLRKADYHTTRAMIQQWRGDFAAARRGYDRAIQLDPRLANAYNNRGLLRMVRGDVRGGLADVDRAIQLDPRRGNFHGNRGTALFQLGRNQQALAAYSLAIRLDSRAAKSFLARGVLRTKLKDYSGALADFAKALAVAPKNAAIHYYRGLTRVRQGDLRTAIGDFSLALKGNSRNARAYLQRGQARHALKDHAGAIRDLSRAIRRMPSSALARIYRASAHLALGQAELALADCSAAVTLKAPRSWRVQALLADVLARLGRRPEAVVVLRKALQTAPAGAQSGLRSKIQRLEGN